VTVSVMSTVKHSQFTKFSMCRKEAETWCSKQLAYSNECTRMFYQQHFSAIEPRVQLHENVFVRPLHMPVNLSTTRTTRTAQIVRQGRPF